MANTYKKPKQQNLGPIFFPVMVAGLGAFAIVGLLILVNLEVWGEILERIT